MLSSCFISLLSAGLLLPQAPTAAPTVQLQRSAVTQSTLEHAPRGLVFPADATADGSTMLLAKVFKPEDIVKPELTPEEEEQAKSEARVKGIVIVALSALPSVWAQDQLVWKKERAGQQVYGSKNKKNAAKGAKRK